MENLKLKKGFTLIELLAVIIILAVIALIATPVVLNVVNKAKDSARKSSVAGYADTVRLALIEEQFGGKSVNINDTFLTSLDYQGDRVSCTDVVNSDKYGVVLHECHVGKDTTNYCFTMGKTYACDNEEYLNIYEDSLNIVKANAPRLITGMTPIKWVDGVETATTESDNEWYDYDNKMWANAKTEDGSYWVWIPRYAYKIGDGWHTSTANSIDIAFLKDDTLENTNNVTIQTSGYNADTEMNTKYEYFLHPAFAEAETKYGFWVAKFEFSGSSDNLQSKPDVSSLRTVTIGDKFTYTQNMKTDDQYGWSSSEVEAHMLTNYEWGAIAYLSNSIYGKNSEVWVNNSSTYTTGCAGSSVSDSSFESCENTYTTANGQQASTTGNITGIYDMSGGTFEYVSGYLDNSDASTYGDSIISSSTSYKNIYSVGTSETREDNYIANKNIYGDAVYETSTNGEGTTSWNSDYSYMPYSSGPWFERGGNYDHTSNAGLFSLNRNNGSAGSLSGWRGLLVPSNN